MLEKYNTIWSKSFELCFFFHSSRNGWGQGKEGCDAQRSAPTLSLESKDLQSDEAVAVFLLCAGQIVTAG